jgi:hypothetical protein
VAGTPGPLSVSITGAPERSVRIADEGTIDSTSDFTFAEVPPGRYTLRLKGRGADSSPPATVTVRDADVDGIALPLLLRIPVSGRVEVRDRSGRPAELPAGLTVQFKTSSGIAFAAVRADGTFAADLREDDYSVSFNLPAGYSATALTSGTTDLLKGALSVRNPAVPPPLTGSIEAAPKP